MTSEHIRHRDEGLVLQCELMSSILTTGQVLDDEHWSRTTTCPPWSVRDLIAHLARGAETFSAMLEAGLRGERTLSISLEEREQRQRDLSALTERELLTTVRSSQEVLQEKLARLEGDALEALCPHTRGLQPAWWFVDQRLSELAFHGWDLHVSLGTEREIPPAVGRFLLPTLLTRNLPTWSKATGEVHARWSIRVTNAPDAAWLIAVHNGTVSVTREPAEAPLTIRGDASGLIRWIYGRADLAALQKQGRAALIGNIDHLATWRQVFPAP